MDKQKKYLDWVIDDLIEKTNKTLVSSGKNIIYYPPWEVEKRFFYGIDEIFHRFDPFKLHLKKYYGVSDTKPVKHILDRFGSTEDEVSYCWYGYFLVIGKIIDEMLKENRLKNLNESISEKRLKLVNAIVDDMVNKTEIWEHPDPNIDSMEIRTPNSFVAWKWGDSQSGYSFSTRSQVWDFFYFVKEYNYPVNFCSQLKIMFPVSDEECMEIWTLYVEEMRIRVNQQLEKGGWGIRV